MNRLLDIKKERKRSKRRYVSHIILISLLSIGVILGSLLSILLSTLDYQVNLILNIVIDCLYLVFMVFYFLNIFPMDRRYYKTYKGMNGVSLENRRNMTFVEVREDKTMDNIVYKVMNFSYKEGENVYEENLYLLDSEYDFVKGESYYLETYQNIIIGVKENNNATL